MKFPRLSMLLMVALAIGLAACAGLQTQKQQIGAACETAASALEAVTAAKVAGRASAAQLADAIRVYKPTVVFCQPVAASLSSVDYAALIRAAATLAAKRTAVQP